MKVWEGVHTSAGVRILHMLIEQLFELFQILFTFPDQCLQQCLQTLLAGALLQKALADGTLE